MAAVKHKTGEHEMGEIKTDPLVDLTGKIAVISGGSSGIGFGTAQLLAEKGAVSVILDIDDKKGQEAIEAISDQGGGRPFLANVM